MQFANSQLRSSCFTPMAVESPGGKVPLGLLKKLGHTTHFNPADPFKSSDSPGQS